MAEQLTIYQDNLGEKQKQLKAMTAELNMHRGQVSDLKLDQENLVAQLGQVKKKYFSRKQQERRQQVMYGNYMEPPPQGTAEYGFGGEGGGFCRHAARSKDGLQREEGLRVRGGQDALAVGLRHRAQEAGG